MPIRKQTLEAYMVINEMKKEMLFVFALFIFTMKLVYERHYRYHYMRTRAINRVEAQMDNLNKVINAGDLTCVELLRMNRNTFDVLCGLLRTVGGLQDSRHVKVEEQVAMFLLVLAHHTKNRVIKRSFLRSGETISRHFNAILKAVLKLHQILLKAPEPVPENSRDPHWKWFKNCLGALDGTYIRLNVPEIDQPRYRTRKGDLAMNVLGVCSQDMQFIYVLPGWEGSAADSRVLRDAITRHNGLVEPTGHYYLVDAGYTNGEGFLAPFRGQRYHLSLWRDGPQPQTPEEFFNMKHSAARNVIERCFGLLKKRWGILRSPSFFPMKTQIRIITACCLLHNLIRREMPTDPVEAEVPEVPPPLPQIGGNRIDTIETSDEWTEWRQQLANEMFNDWMATRGHA